MKDVKKTVLWVLVGICVISAFFGIFNLIASLQMVTLKVSQIYLNEAKIGFFKGTTIAALICAIACLAAVVLAIVYFIKSKHSKLNVLILILLIATAVISVFFTVYSFIVPAILKAGNEEYWSYSSSGEFNYSSFLHYQAYLSAALSTFLPLLVSAGLVLCNVLCGDKCKKQDAPEEPAEK